MGMNINVELKKAITTVALLFAIGFIGLIFLLIFGNLQGNLGFAAGSQGANDTNQVIGNLTSGGVTFFGQFPLIFQILGIFLLVTIFIGMFALVVLVLSYFNGKKGGGNFA